LDLEQRFAAQERRLIEGVSPRLRGRLSVVVDAWPARKLPALPLAELRILPAACWPDGQRGTSRSWPYATGGTDLVVWRHAHECWPLPESLLVETDRVLGPDGLLLILGFRPLAHWLCHLVNPGLRLPLRTPHGLGSGLVRLGFERQYLPARTVRREGFELPLLSVELRSRARSGVILDPAGRDWPRLSPNTLSWPTRRVA
jgi:hypothetical protein